jgi:hypothetical protein
MSQHNAISSPVPTGEGDREAVEGATAGAPSSPSTTLREVPLPRFAGEERS